MARLVRAWLTTGVTDGLFSSVLSVAAYGSTVSRLFQGVASAVIGPRALDGGSATAALGVLMHFGVALAWSIVFLLLYSTIGAIRNAVRTRGGVFAVAAIYGPFVWLVMSLVVMPALTHRMTPIAFRWWVQLIGHAPFVGLPIVASIARTPRD